MNELKITPKERGKSFAKSGLSVNANPYIDNKKRKEFVDGYNQYLRRVSGIPKGKEMPLP